MDRLIEYLIERLRRVQKMDRAALLKEAKELLYFVNRQAFRQIPSVSAIGGILVGAWISSTFTTSPLKGALASFGIIKGGRHVVSSTTYSVISVALPLLSAAVTAYIIQKSLKSYRERRLKMDMEAVKGLDKDSHARLDEKLSILEKAREAGLLSEGEFLTKRASLYQSYSRKLSSRIEEIVMDKLS